MPWPIEDPSLSARPVEILVNVADYENDLSNSLIIDFGKIYGHQCPSLKDLVRFLCPDIEEGGGDADVAKQTGDVQSKQDVKCSDINRSEIQI